MFHFADRYCFGGSGLKKSHAKNSRPLSSKSAVHVVFKRSSIDAFNRQIAPFASKDSLLRHTALKLGKKFNVKIYNVRTSSSDIQILLRFTKRRQFQNFLRAFAGLIARKFLRAERGSARKYDTLYAKYEGGQSDPAKGATLVKEGCRFWAQRPFSRIVPWGPKFQQTLKTLSSKSQNLPSFGFLSNREIDALGFKHLQANILKSLRHTFGYA
ncbi:hypothetical protein GW916_06660 [bacterium]|nr:hypothetical protein [bacterium]